MIGYKLLINKMIILYINDEHCSSVEQLKGYFKIGTNYDNPIVMELLDYGRAGDISDWLREKGESELAKAVDNLNDNLGDSEYFSQLTAIITGERGVTEKPEFQKCFYVENFTAEKADNGIIVCVQLKILSSVNESYELAVRTNWGTKGNIINPYKFEEGSTVNLEFKFRKRPNSEINQLTLFADEKEVYSKDGILLGQNIVEFTIGDCCFKMIKIAHGTFNMGAGKETHQVTLTKDYYMGETQVTQALWKSVTGDEPSFFEGENRPVEQVSWEDCHDFIQKLNKKLSSQLGNMRFRMPTEAEWEFAARGGNNSKGYQYSGGNNIEKVACHNRSDTHNVANKQPNELGLYDMSGNVYEWCHDRYDDYLGIAEIDPTGPDSGEWRICRGGTWKDGTAKCRLWYRNSEAYYRKNYYIGLRLAMSK